METRNHRFSVTQLVQMSLLAAVAYILMFFPTIPFSYFKLDFGDIPILIGTMLFGPVGGITIAAVKVLIYWITGGASVAGLIGDLASLIASIVIVLTIYGGQKWFKNRNRGTRAVLTVGLETISLTVVLAILNWLVITPLYARIVGFTVPNMFQYILIQVIPFNLVKGIVIGGLFMIVEDRLAGWIQRHQ